MDRNGFISTCMLQERAALHVYQESSSYAQQIINQCDGSYSPSRPLHVTILTCKWRWRSFYDSSFLSSELAIQLAKFPQVKVTYLVQENSCQEWEKREAARSGVTIVEAKEQPGFDDPFQWPSLIPPEDLSTDIVVGVGEKASKMTQFFKTYQHCKSIVFDCDLYREFNLLIKELSYELSLINKQKLELRHRSNCRDVLWGDLSVAVGPKIYNEHCRSQKTRVFKLTPGILSEFKDVTHDTSESTKFQILMMGSDDPENFDDEEFDIAAKAVAELNDRSCEVVYVGAAEYGDERFIKKFCQYGVDRKQLRIRKCPTVKDLKSWFLEADLVIMPSSEQQFGMMGLAALSSGLPVLVHGDSGFGRALKAVKFGDTATVDSEDATEWAKKIKKLQKIGRKLRLEQASLLRSFYDEKYSWEIQCGALIKEMSSMVFAQQGQIEMETG